MKIWIWILTAFRETLYNTNIQICELHMGRILFVFSTCVSMSRNLESVTMDQTEA